jgi:hypothetical protein
MLKIQRSANGGVVFTLSGRIEVDDAQSLPLVSGTGPVLLRIPLFSVFVHRRLGSLPRSRIKLQQTNGGRHENQGIRKSRDVTRETPSLHVELSQLELQHAHIDDISGNARHLYSISDSDSTLPHQYEIAEARENYILQSNRHSGREKPEVRCQRTQV